MLGDADVAPSIAVSDLAAAKEFYGNVLGLKEDNESPGGVLYKSGGCWVFVYPSPSAGTNKATYAGWVTKDVEGVAEGLKAKGVSLLQYDDIPGVTRKGDIHYMDGEDTMAIWFEDPSGNILSVSNQMG
jgi:catechol 2,3-dioxygenase-like lactoylglutathione lyase family enzyme